MELETQSQGSERHFIEFGEQNMARWLDSSTEIPSDCQSVESHLTKVIGNGLQILRSSCADYEPVKFTCRLTVRKKIRLASPKPKQLDMKLIDQV